MTNHGDDCYFFYYSTCSKGDGCPFRHCEAAMGSETVCNLWQEGRCFRMVCKFRHMEIKKNRREIACYWENQPAGCQKPHCAFHHEKPRMVDGIYIPPDKGSAQKEMVEPQEDPAPPPPAPPPLPTAANPQLRGVIKAETQESVPSPTHPPVVINPADDDEDEDDQFSEEEASPRKLAKGSSSDDSLNFGIRTLEEIRLRKALKASMKRYGQPLGEDTDALSAQRTNGVREKENIRSYSGPVLFPASDDDIFAEESGRRNVAERLGSVVERLGNRVVKKDVPAGGADLPPKRRLSERLGRMVDQEEDVAPQKALKPMRERLGMPVGPSVATQSAEPPAQAEKPPAEVRIKTLEEIRLSKAAKNPKSAAPATTAAKTSPRGSKRSVTVKPSSTVQVKTFSEIIHAKRKLEQQQQQQQRLKKAKQQPATEEPGDSPGVPTDAAAPSRGASPPRAGVRVKTLEEIRREKAARTRAQGEGAGDGESPEKVLESGEDGAKKPRILRVNKPASPVPSASNQKTAEPEKTVDPTAATEAPPRPADAGRTAATNGGVKVKTFEEIMREKRLRRQHLEEQASSSSSSASQSDGSVEADRVPPPPGPALQRTTPVRAREDPPAASSPSPSSSPNPSQEAPPKTVPARQRVSLKPKAASPAPVSPGDASSLKRASPPRQAEADSASPGPQSSSTSPGKRKRASPGAAPPRPARGAGSPWPSVEEAALSPAQDGVQRKSPGHATEAKVRPKLNVRPSVVKPAAQVKPGQKRKAPESAVAAVKPLNSSSIQPPSKRKGVSSSSVEAQPSPVVPRTPPTLLGPDPGTTSPLRVELQAVPVTSSVPSAPTAAPESPVMKSPGQLRPRRPSMAAPAAATTTSSTVDDFDELLNEFTGDDDRLADEMELDHGKGEDDLLLELSEMIDS